MSTPDRPEDHWTPTPPAAPAGETPDFSAATAPGTAAPDVVQDAARPPGQRGRRVLSAAALATGLAVGGAAVAAAVSTDGGSRAVAAVAPAAGLSAAGGLADDGGHGPGGLGGPGMRSALHGELTVPQTDGTGTQVVLVQSGTVTAVSKTSLSVRSTDGFTATYTITSATRVRAKGDTGITGVKSGATVWVVSSSSHSALMVADRAGGPKGMRGMPGRHDRPGDGDGDDAPSSTPSGSATSGSTSGTALDAPGVAADL